MNNFICVNDLDNDHTLVINIDQIIWYDTNTRTIMMVDGPIVTDAKSMAEVIHRINKLADRAIPVRIG